MHSQKTFQLKGFLESSGILHEEIPRLQWNSSRLQKAQNQMFFDFNPVLSTLSWILFKMWNWFATAMRLASHWYQVFGHVAKRVITMIACIIVWKSFSYYNLLFFAVNDKRGLKKYRTKNTKNEAIYCQTLNTFILGFLQCYYHLIPWALYLLIIYHLQ